MPLDGWVTVAPLEGTTFGFAFGLLSSSAGLDSRLLMSRWVFLAGSKSGSPSGFNAFG